MSSKKRKHAEEHENEERWLLTYADLITLLMAFFVIMYALSKVDVKKFDAISLSLGEAFANPRLSPVQLPGVSLIRGGREKEKNKRSSEKNAPRKTSEKSKIQKLGKDIGELFKDTGLSPNVQITEDKKGRKLTVRLENSLLFNPGSADLTPKAGELIQQFGELIVKSGMQVRVEGHTDNIPIHNAQFQSNWQLSTARASSVIMELINKCHVVPELLSASGYGEYRPIVSNDTPENRAKNRRVEFVITDNSEEENEGEGEGEGEGAAETPEESGPVMKAQTTGEVSVEPAPETGAAPETPAETAPAEMLSVKPLPEAAVAPPEHKPNP